MKIMVIGGAGFIGSHLCDYYLAAGNEVVCVDNLITGSEKNIACHFNNAAFSFLKLDVTAGIAWPGGLDCVLNFASPASPVDYLKYPLETLRVGSVGTTQALELAKEKGAKFLMASTSEIYGDPLVSPQKEGYWGNVNSIGPRSVYDEAKRYSESVTMAYHRLYGLDAKIARIFNTYGPRMRPADGRVIPNFVSQALAKKPLTVYGEGRQTRSFCYVSDLVRGLDKLLRSKLNEPVNLGNPDERTIMDMARVISRLTGIEYQVVHQPLPEDDPKVRRPDIAKAKRELGWEPAVKLEDGLKITIDWFQKNIKC